MEALNSTAVGLDDVSWSLSPSLVRAGYAFDFGAGHNPRRPPRILYSSEDDDVSLPPEPTRTCLGEWRRRLVEVDKYVDDNLGEECVNFENALVVDVLGVNHKIKQAIGTQNFFRHVVRRAENKGMKVNTSKTAMVCISASQNFVTSSFFLDVNGQRIDSGDKLKMLGWHFSSRPTVDAYLEVMKRRFRQRYWVLRHLKHNGFEEKDLVTVYKMMVRPVADYMMEVYHSMLTDHQDEAVERLQSHALKCIFGPRLSARRLRELAEVSTLTERRIEYCDKFARKCIESDRFCDWFPKKNSARITRGGEEFEEKYARCERLYNSPLFYMRRRLNGKQGKKYGLRNQEYRK